MREFHLASYITLSGHRSQNLLKRLKNEGDPHPTRKKKFAHYVVCQFIR